MLVVIVLLIVAVVGLLYLFRQNVRLSRQLLGLDTAYNASQGLVDQLTLAKRQLGSRIDADRYRLRDVEAQLTVYDAQVQSLRIQLDALATPPSIPNDVSPSARTARSVPSPNPRPPRKRTARPTTTTPPIDDAVLPKASSKPSPARKKKREPNTTNPGHPTENGVDPT